MGTASIPFGLSGLPATPGPPVRVGARHRRRPERLPRRRDAARGVEPALDECARLLARARALKIPVNFVQHDAGPLASPYDPSAECGRDRRQRWRRWPARRWWSLSELFVGTGSTRT